MNVKQALMILVLMVLPFGQAHTSDVLLSIKTQHFGVSTLETVPEIANKVCKKRPWNCRG